MLPALKRREQHEEIGGAVALIFVIDARRLTAFHRQGPCFPDELFRGLVETDQWPVRIAAAACRPPECPPSPPRTRRWRVGRWWNDPLFFQVRSENVFLASGRSYCCWHARDA